MAELSQESERNKEGTNPQEKPSIGVVSCDDEGYETAGKKTLTLRQKSSTKEGRKSHECAPDDDGYETAGKKELVPAAARVRSGDKQGRKSRGGSVSPRSDNRDHTHSTPEQETIDKRIHKLIAALEGIVTVDQLNNDAVELLKLVPDGYLPLPHQVGGHRHIDGKVGFLRCISKPHLLYKPVQEGPKGAREVSFYDSLFGMSSVLGTPKETFPSLYGETDQACTLLPIVPIYYGLTNIADRSGKTCDYLILEDITHKFVHPCIMDLKIGQRVWDDHAGIDKIEREKKKYPAQETLGFRIVGMRTYIPSTGEYAYYDRHFGRSVTENTAKEALGHFFEAGNDTFRSDMVNRIVSKLTSFKEWMENQSTLRLFATSLLIVYEGDPSLSHNDDSLDIRLVDFAHCYEQNDNNRPDGNVLYGVEVFMRYLNEFQVEFSK